MTARRRVRLRTIAARQVWDGRKARGGSGFIPGIRHFQVGVRAYRAAAARGNADATAARLEEIDAALGAFEQSLDRWRRGLAGFASASLNGGTAPAQNGGWRRSARLLRIRAPATRRVAGLIAAYDAACADTVAVTRACREVRMANPHSASIGDRRRRLQALMALGYGGLRLRTDEPGQASTDSGQAANGGGFDRIRGDRPRPR